MSEYNRIDSAALDRHITGNYGEDQFNGECDDYEVDEYGIGWDESGEIVGYHPDEANSPDAYLPDMAEESVSFGLPEADLVMRRLRETDAKMAGLKAEFDAEVAAIGKQYNRRVKRLYNKRNWIVASFGTALEALAKSFVGDRVKNKYLDLSNGRLSFRKVPGGAIAVLDEAKALAWAWSEAPSAIVKHPDTLSKDALKKLKTELPLDLFEVSKEREAFEISTGIKV